MTHVERENLKSHLLNPPIGHGHRPLEFGPETVRSTNEDHDLIAWHMNAHGVFRKKDLHAVE